MRTGASVERKAIDEIRDVNAHAVARKIEEV